YIRNVTVVPIIHVNQFTGEGGSNVSVTYEIEHGSVGAFDIGFYRSTDTRWDGGDIALSTVHITAPPDLTLRVHTKTLALGTGPGQVALPGAGAADVDADYYLLAVADPTNAVANEGSDNPFTQDFVAAFAGAYHAAGSDVYIHGSDGADRVRLLTGTG